MTIYEYQCDGCLTIFRGTPKVIRFREWNLEEDKNLGCSGGHFQPQTYCKACVSLEEES